MTVIKQIEMELKKALDAGKVGIDRGSVTYIQQPFPCRPVSRAVSSNAIIYLDRGGDCLFEVNCFIVKDVGGCDYQLYDCTDPSFTPEECKSLFDFLNEYDKHSGLLKKLKDINN